jgi:hypothetical protein
MNTRQRRHQISMGRAALNRPNLPPEVQTGLLGPVYVVASAAIGGPPGTGISHYEVHVAPDGGLKTTPTILLTRDPDLFEQAVDLESRQVLVACAWHRSRRPTGVYCQVIDCFKEGV